MTATFMPVDVDSTTSLVEGNESDIERAPDYIDAANAALDRRDAAIRIPYLSRLLQRTNRQWSVCVVETCIAQQTCKGLCSKEVRIFEHASIVSATSDNH